MSRPMIHDIRVAHFPGIKVMLDDDGDYPGATSASPKREARVS